MNTTYSEKIQIELVEHLKQYKQKSGKSYDHLSRDIGIHWRTIYLWLAGKTKPSFMAQEKLQAFFKTHK